MTEAAGHCESGMPWDSANYMMNYHFFLTAGMFLEISHIDFLLKTLDVKV